MISQYKLDELLAVATKQTFATMRINPRLTPCLLFNYVEEVSTEVWTGRFASRAKDKGFAPCIWANYVEKVESPLIHHLLKKYDKKTT